MTYINQITNRHIAAQSVIRVAQSLSKRGDAKNATELTSIAQFLGGEMMTAGGAGADRLSEGSDFQVNLRDGGGQNGGQGGFDPSQEMPPMGGGGGHADGEHPGIAPFAKKSPQEQTIPTMIHTVSMTLTAPPEVTETDMLNDILGMRDRLGVDASNVQWSKKEQAIKARVS